MPLVVAQDMPCRKCGYNLRGLSTDGQCPECSTPVRLSVSGDLLRYSEPQYVEGLAQGAKLLLWGILIAFVLGFIIGAVTNFVPAPVRAVLVFVLVAGSMISVV